MTQTPFSSSSSNTALTPADPCIPSWQACCACRPHPPLAPVCRRPTPLMPACGQGQHLLNRPAFGQWASCPLQMQTTRVLVAPPACVWAATHIPSMPLAPAGDRFPRCLHGRPIADPFPALSLFVAHCLQEADPLDAFMAELKDLEAGQSAPQPAPDKKQSLPDVGLDEEADNVADFMEVRTATLRCVPGYSWECSGVNKDGSEVWQLYTRKQLQRGVVLVPNRLQVCHVDIRLQNQIPKLWATRPAQGHYKARLTVPVPYGACTDQATKEGCLWEACVAVFACKALSPAVGPCLGSAALHWLQACCKMLPSLPTRHTCLLSGPTSTALHWLQAVPTCRGRCLQGMIACCGTAALHCGRAF